MRKFDIYLTNDDIHMRRFRIKANTLNGAVKKAIKIKRRTGYAFIYEINTRIKGRSLWQPVYDWYNGGTLKNYFNLKI